MLTTEDGTDYEVEMGMMSGGMWSSVRERMPLGCISAVIDAVCRSVVIWGDSIVKMVCCPNCPVSGELSTLEWHAKKGS